MDNAAYDSEPLLPDPELVPKVCCGTSENARIWLNTKRGGIIASTIVVGFIVFPCVVTLSIVIKNWLGYEESPGIVHASLVGYLTLMALICFFRTMLSNPGAVPSDAIPWTGQSIVLSPDSSSTPGNSVKPRISERKKNKGPMSCTKCNALKPRRAHHCRICDRCVTKMDHHCPWVNNCIGISNLKFFLQFLFYMTASSVYTLVLTLMRSMTCKEEDGSYNCHDHSSYVVTSTIFAMICAVLGGGLFLVQLETALSGTPLVDRKQNRGPNAGDNAYVDLFGGGGELSWTWVFPVDVHFNHPDQVLGYSRGYVSPA